MTAIDLQKRADFKQILLDNLPDILDDEQKENKVRNNLQALRKSGILEVFGNLLKMSKEIFLDTFRRFFRQFKDNLNR